MAGVSLQEIIGYWFKDFGLRIVDCGLASPGSPEYFPEGGNQTADFGLTLVNNEYPSDN
jgi:hypothetical protein